MENNNTIKLAADSSWDDVKNYLLENYREWILENNYSTRKVETEFGVLAHLSTEGCVADGQSYEEIYTFLGRYFAMPCWHSSWSESSYEVDDIYEVVPQERTITEYVKKN